MSFVLNGISAMLISEWTAVSSTLLYAIQEFNMHWLKWEAEFLRKSEILEENTLLTLCCVGWKLKEE